MGKFCLFLFVRKISKISLDFNFIAPELHILFTFYSYNSFCICILSSLVLYISFIFLFLNQAHEDIIYFNGLSK